MTSPKTREPQYQACLDLLERQGVSAFGVMSNTVWHEDPKRIGFLLSRYKFVAKLFTGLNSALEVGCADAFGTRVVRQAVPQVTAVDFDPLFIKNAKENMDAQWPLDLRVHDILERPVDGQFEGAYSIDVIEHIPAKDEDRYLSNIVTSLIQPGILIIGTPSIQSQAYASSQSKEGHINCKDADQLRALLYRYFHIVFLFSMNDEVVHTGYYPMAQYLMAVCCAKKTI